NIADLEEDEKIALEKKNLQELRLKRHKEIVEGGHTVSPDELKRAEVDHQIELLKLERIRAQINNRSLFAPFPGVITEIHRELGESATGPDTAILTLVQLHQLQLTLHLPPELITETFGTGTVLTLTYGDGQSTTGTVSYLSPVIDAASNTVRIRLLLDNPNGFLRSGHRCTYAPSATSQDPEKATE
ncbi:MAG: efflux RND transporter periplasmic adaptor subunit, partial [Puniceicoccales bacterium]